MRTEQEKVDLARNFLEHRGFVVARSKNAIREHFLTQSEAAKVLGISDRRLAELRHEPWFPKPITLGKRSHRFLADELIAAMSANAPRADVGDEPEHLKRIREGA